jgi:cytochrome c oxidase subunit 4
MSEAAVHPAGYKVYFITWFWLLVMTSLALGVGFVDMPEGLKAALLVAITLAKVAVIAAFFMHLRTEKLNLILLTFTPLVISMILFFFMGPDMMGSATRVLTLR